MFEGKDLTDEVYLEGEVSQGHRKAFYQVTIANTIQSSKGVHLEAPRNPLAHTPFNKLIILQYLQGTPLNVSFLDHFA